MSTSEILRAAKALIADEHKWTQGAYARTYKQHPIGPNEDGACSFCAVGALAHIICLSPRQVENERTLLAGVFLNQAAEEIAPGFRPVGVNDLRGHVAVMAMYDRAIELAEAVV